MNVLGDISVSTQGQAKDGYSLKYQEDEIKAFEKGKQTGTSDDFSLVYEHIQKQYNLPSKNAAKKILKQAGVTPHHKSDTVIELIPTDLHRNVPHIGSASDLRGGY